MVGVRGGEVQGWDNIAAWMRGDGRPWADDALTGYEAWQLTQSAERRRQEEEVARQAEAHLRDAQQQECEDRRRAQEAEGDGRAAEGGEVQRRTADKDHVARCAEEEQQQKYATRGTRVTKTGTRRRRKTMLP